MLRSLSLRGPFAHVWTIKVYCKQDVTAGESNARLVEVVFVHCRHCAIGCFRDTEGEVLRADTAASAAASAAFCSSVFAR